MSESAKEQKMKAEKELEQFVLRYRRLEGQILKNQNSFINPQIAPLNTPEPNRF